MLKDIAIVVAGLVAGPCSSAAAQEQADYFPLQVGNSWTYVCDMAGQERESTYSIIASEMLGEHEYFLFNRSFPFFPTYQVSGAETISRKTEDGDVVLWFGEQDVLCYEFSDTTLDSARVTHMDDVPGFEAGMDFITGLRSTQDTIITPAAQFDHCYRFISLVHEIKDQDVMVWFAPQAGPVRFQYCGESNEDFVLKSAVIDGQEYVVRPGPGSSVEHMSWGRLKRSPRKR